MQARAVRGLGAALSTVHHAVSRGPPRKSQGGPPGAAYLRKCTGLTPWSLVRIAMASAVGSRRRRGRSACPWSSPA